MFNPKENLLDQQLAQSGLEMNVDPFTIASAGFSLVSGVMGMNQAKSDNAKAEAYQKKQKKLAKEQAKITNNYNKASFEAEKKDYFAARKFQYDMAVKQWEYDTKIQDLRYQQDMRAYRQSVENYGQQLFYNNLANMTALESQQASYNELLTSAAFEKQGMLAEQLQSEGQAAMGQAGVSTGRAVTMATAAAGRDLAVLRASLVSSQKEYTRSRMDLALQKYGADMQAKANLMIKPDRLPELIKPEMAPERTFVEPAKVLPGAVPPARTTNPYLPLVGSIASASRSLVGAFDND